MPPASSPGQHWRYAGFIKPATTLTRKPPSVLSPFAQLWCYLHWGDVISVSSEGVTPLSWLLRAHVPLPLGSLLLRRLASFEESLQVVLSPCCPRELPDVISENLSLDAGSRTPAVPPSALTCFFPGVIGLPPAKAWVGFPLLSANHDFSRSVFRGCRYFLMFRPPSLLTPQIVPTAAHLATGQPGLLRPGISCFVTSTRTGYANRPNTGN